MAISGEETVGSLCARHPLAVPVFHQLGLGAADLTRSLATCCDERGLTEVDVRSAIDAAEQAVTILWRGSPVSDLVDHILRTYHRPLVHEVAELVAVIESARTSGGDGAWSSLLEQVTDLHAELEKHIEMEERVVFPWLRGRATPATASIRAMQLEHADVIALLLTIENQAATCLASDPTNPHGAEVTARLDHFTRTLCEHIHLEANVLFPRALQAEITRR